MLYTEIEPLYIALYKPAGVISALSDPEGRPHLGELLRRLPTRVTPIGRMDFNSEGLILLTNDGKLGEAVFKTRELPKTYLVKVKGHPEPKEIEFFKKGIFTQDGVVRFSSCRIAEKLRNKTWLELRVIEGAKLNLRELLNHRGLMVDRIIRTAIGKITTSGMEPGEFKLLKRQDFESLLQ